MTFPLSLTFDDVQIVPSLSDVESRTLCNLRTRITRNYRLDIPIVAAPMDTVCEAEMMRRLWHLGGLGFLHRFGSIDEQVEVVKEVLSDVGDYIVLSGDLDAAQLPFGACVGAKGDFVERGQTLVDAGVNILLIDVAHGHHTMVRDAITRLKKEVKGTFDVVAGNVATYDGARALCEWGADAVRVGVGNGAVCTTRINTGSGVPQVTAIIEAVRACDEFDVPVMADGGMRYPGDVAKALALGASTAMFGSLFAGTDESPGPLIRLGSWPNEQLYKEYRGSASRNSKVARGEKDRNVEGVSTTVPYKGSVTRIVDDLTDGVRSAMSYVGAHDMDTFCRNAEFTRITNAGAAEAQPHVAIKI